MSQIPSEMVLPLDSLTCRGAGQQQLSMLRQVYCSGRKPETSGRTRLAAKAVPTVLFTSCSNVPVTKRSTMDDLPAPPAASVVVVS